MHHQDHAADMSSPKKNVFTCPMHVDVQRDMPGLCPECGMNLVPAKPNKTHTVMDHADHDKHAGHSPNMFKQKFWLCLALTVPVLAFSDTVQHWLHYRLAFGGSQYIPPLFGLILFFYGGMVFLKSARVEIAGRRPGMMTLISMAITVAFGYSLAVTLRLVGGMDFWWELATLVTIMLLGHWLEMASVQNAQGALKELAKLLPDEAELVTKEGTNKVPVGDLKRGDMVLVRPGTNVPADGEVANGESDVNESMLTGESKPVRKTAGSVVIGGTINGSGSLTVRITKVGDDTVLAGIMRLVAEAQNSKSKTQILADRAAFYLTFIAIGAAVVTVLGWALFSDRSAAFILARVVTVLVIACPHALGLAVPLVTAISTTMAAKNGLLVRQRMALEAARNVDVVMFDKTGTLTKGEQGVVDVAADGDARNAVAMAAAVEADSEHPIARAVTRYAHDRRIRPLPARAFQSLAGKGVRAEVDGRTVYVGSPQLAAELNADIPQALQDAAQQAAHDGKTVIYVMVESSVAGILMLADGIREESKQAVSRLHAMGKRVAMLTGDNAGVAAWVARELGIAEYFAEVLPEHKAAMVKKLQADGSKVAMVGDGVNDAPALAQADIGIAIGAGTDVAIESAGIVLASSDPRGVARVITLSRATYRKMVQNLLWGAGYNAVTIPLAAGVTAGFGFVLSPAVGAVLMSLSTIIVAVNAQFLRRVRL
ncbi:MAG TPA: heavy metal translocating P-type ATPase [Candidatus Saccharimonadales bacterium]|nr:heavy metal translocating P-type ATPase [Candidatus Saccharimonadales bacterium]